MNAAAGSAHDRYRSRIVALLELAAAGPIGGHAAPGWWTHFARFHPRRASWATVVQAGPGPDPAMVTAEIYSADDAPADVVPTAAGPVAVTPFPSDPRLPTLPEAVAGLGEHRIVRYRPGSRCTISVTTDDGGRWLKVLRTVDPREQQLAEARWAAARTGTLAVRVARPDRIDAGQSCIWQHHLPGRPVIDVVRSPAAAALAGRIGEALASLARTPLPTWQPGGRAVEIARTERGIKRVGRTVPFLAGALATRLSQLARIAAAGELPEERAVPIHGSPHAHQWLIDDEERLGLVDFDRSCAGEPELDAATFLAELQFEHGLTVGIDVIEAGLVDGYAAAGLPLDPTVLRWYLAHKLMSKVVRTTTALRADGDRRAGDHLAAVDAAMAKGPNSRQRT